jgi:hypothetical protein
MKRDLLYARNRTFFISANTERHRRGGVYPSSLKTIEFRFFNFFRNFARENPKKMVIKESAAEFL